MFYRTFRAFLAVCLRIFYRRIEAAGQEAVPREGPLLIVANHGGALMDPLVLLVLIPRPISFLAKHTLFPLPVIGFFLRRIGGIPVYRRQDQPSESGGNEAMFEACRRVLEAGGAVSIFPEGTSHDRPRLLPLKTGAARIYFRVAGEVGHKLRVIPVGINFEQKKAFRSRALVLFGRPLETGDVRGLEAETPGRGVEVLTERIEKGLESLLPGLDSWEELEFIRQVQRLYAGARPASLVEEAPVLKRFLDAYRHYRRTNPETVQTIRRSWEAYRRQLARFSLTDDQVELAQAPARAVRFLITSGALVLFAAPLALLGLAVHVVPYVLTAWVERRFNRHPDQAATMKLLAGLALYPLTYLVVLAFPFASGGWRMALPGLVLLPIAGWAALLLTENRQRLRESARALVLAAPGGRALHAIRRQRQRILDQVGDLVRSAPPTAARNAGEDAERTAREG